VDGHWCSITFTRSCYELRFRPAALRQLHKLDTQIAWRIKVATEALRVEPRPPSVKTLTGQRGWLRIRVGDYRIVCEVRDSELVVLVIQIGHRSEVCALAAQMTRSRAADDTDCTVCADGSVHEPVHDHHHREGLTPTTERYRESRDIRRYARSRDGGQIVPFPRTSGCYGASMLAWPGRTHWE
jgi:mRNA interferase RelE/StbE